MCHALHERDAPRCQHIARTGSIPPCFDKDELRGHCSFRTSLSTEHKSSWDLPAPGASQLWAKCSCRSESLSLGDNRPTPREPALGVRANIVHTNCNLLSSLKALIVVFVVHVPRDFYVDTANKRCQNSRVKKDKKSRFLRFRRKFHNSKLRVVHKERSENSAALSRAEKYHQAGVFSCACFVHSSRVLTFRVRACVGMRAF